MYFKLDIFHWECILNRMIKILQDDSTRNIWLFSLKLQALVAESTADINKNRLSWIPVLGFFFDRVAGEPRRHLASLAYHKVTEVVDKSGMCLQPEEERAASVEGNTYWGMSVVRDILITALGKVIRSCLQCRTKKVEANSVVIFWVVI